MPDIAEKGREGENIARDFLKGKGFSIFEIDWLAERDGECLQIEVKNKEHFKAPPFNGMGMEIWKVKRRLKFEAQFRIPAYLLCFDTDGMIYGQYLKILDTQGYFDTKNGIRIYPLASFKVLGKRGGI